jgi:hypothetical protein
LISSTLPYQVSAAYEDLTGLVHLFQGASGSMRTLNQMVHDWNQPDSVHPWTEKPAGGELSYTVDPHVWTEIGDVASQQTMYDGKFSTGTVGGFWQIYRLNTNNPSYDYFMVRYTGNQSVSSFNNCTYDWAKFGIVCAFANKNFVIYGRFQKGKGQDVGEVIDSSPKSQVVDGTYSAEGGFDLGGQIGCQIGDAPGVSSVGRAVVRPAAFFNRTVTPNVGAKCSPTVSANYSSKVSETWKVQSFSISNYTKPGSSKASWQGSFDLPNAGSGSCDKYRENAKGSGDMGAIAIFRVKRSDIYNNDGVGKVHFYAQLEGRTTAQSHLLGSCGGFRDWDQYAYNDTWPEFGMPTLKVLQTALSLKAHQGSAKLLIDSKRPLDNVGLAPNLSLFRNGALIDPSSVGLSIWPDDQTGYAIQNDQGSAYPRLQTWTITSSNAQTGTYTLFIDTAPGGQTDSTRSGPIAVSITVN